MHCARVVSCCSPNRTMHCVRVGSCCTAIIKTAIDMDKKELRKSKIKAREALSEEDRIRFSSAICERITAMPEYESAETIFIYKWVKGEVRLDDLEKAASTAGKRLVYPLCISKTEMIAIEPGKDDGAWAESGFMGIMEPVREKGRDIAPSDIDLVICPCSSFDEDCRRLGMGGGFYDRYLPGCINAAKIAVAFEAQKSEKIPADHYDQPVDTVITEAGCYMNQIPRSNLSCGFTGA